MKWRYSTIQVTGDIGQAVEFVNRTHPDWDVVSVQQMTSKNPDVTVVVYREATEVAAPPSEFRNDMPGPGPGPNDSVSSPMTVLMRQWPGLDSNVVMAKVQHMSVAEFNMQPPYVREKMNEMMAYYQTVDSNFTRPAWYTGNAVHPFYPKKGG